MESSQLPLDKMLRLGSTGEFRILAGRSGLQRPVNWVNTVDGTLALKYQPAAAEFVLLLPPYPELAAQVRRFAKCQSAGVGLLADKLPADLHEWAEKTGFPIIALPGGSDLIQLQRALLRLLLDNEAGVLARKAEIYQRLARLSAESKGLDSIARALAEITGKGILIHDKRLQVLAAAPPLEKAESWNKLVEWSSAPANLPPELLDRKRAAAVREPIAQTPAEGGERLIAPIIVHDMARGFLSIVGPGLMPAGPSDAEGFDRLDRIALEQGAEACALEMAKAKAVSETQKRLTGDLIEAVLTNSVSEVDAGRWAERAGYRRAGPHVAMALQWASQEAPSPRRLETIVSGEVKRIPSRAVAQLREEQVVVFYAQHLERGLADSLQWAQRIYDLAIEEFPEARLAVGLGRPSESLLGLRQSYHEAAQAMALEHKLRHRRPHYFGDLGIYRLLLQLEGSPELRSFSSEVLGSLIEYDRAQGTNLLETLSAYFQHNANLAQTAQALFVHRNTLLYRLQRASEIGKFDLDKAETRLAIQLALRAYELSRDESDFLPPL
jgi:PucR family transcriptional regulator, purine catabolism regulatory protein